MLTDFYVSRFRFNQRLHELLCQDIPLNSNSNLNLNLNIFTGKRVQRCP